MKNNCKRLLAFVLAGMLALVVLTGCGGSAPSKLPGSITKPTKVGDVNIPFTTVSYEPTTNSQELYQDKKIIVVAFTMVNQSEERPLELDASPREGTVLSQQKETDFDEAFSAFFARGSKWFTAEVDGQAADCRSCLKNGESEDVAVLAANRSGVVQLYVVVPQDWKTLDVTFTPSNGDGASQTFRVTPANLK